MAVNILSSRKNREINRVVMLPLAQITKNPNQPRSYFANEDLQELSRSIIANGLLQPITVRRVEDSSYELVAGERRMLAYQLLGRELIPSIVEEYTEQQSAVFALIENLQRKDLNYFEEAAGIQRLMDLLDLTQQQISVRLGKAQSTVANKLRLLRYSPEQRQKILDAGLTERHARALLKLADNEQLEQAVDRVIRCEYNVSQTEQYVESLLCEKELQLRTRLFVVKDMRMFQNSIHKAVTMMNLAGIPIENEKTETDEYIQYTIRVPKDAVYKEREYKKAVARDKLGAV